METSESIIKIVPAIIAVMKATKGVDKSLSVGSGRNAYNGVADKDVKRIMSEQLAKNGLCVVPTKIEEETKFSEWDAEYNGNTQRKQSLFTKVKTEYLLLHTSGEFITIAGYGHGVDSQDKSAGKATTYALKNALLYTFLVPTGVIDDTENTHSDTYEVPPKAKPAPKQEVKTINIEEARTEVETFLNDPKNEAAYTATLKKYNIKLMSELSDTQIAKLVIRINTKI